MKMYVFAILKTGSYSTDKKISDSLFMGHMKNIKHLTDSEKLLDAELFQWYGSAALAQYLKYHELV